MKGLRELGDVVAIILSSFMFAIMHGSMEQFIYQFIVGFAIGSVVMVTGNYLAGCIMHFANNFFAQVFSVTLETLKLGTTEHAIFEIISMTVGAFAIMISICYFAKFLINKTKTENKEKSKFEMHSLIAKESSYEYQCSFEHYSKNIPLNKKGQDATVYMDKKGKIRKINYSSNKVLTIAVLSLSIAYGVFLVIVRDFGLLGIIIKNIFGIK